MIANAKPDYASIADKPEFDQLCDQLRSRNYEDAYRRRTLRQNVRTDVVVLTRYAYNIIVSHTSPPLVNGQPAMSQLWGMPIAVVPNTSYLREKADRLKAEGKRVLVLRDPVPYQPKSPAPSFPQIVETILVDEFGYTKDSAKVAIKTQHEIMVNAMMAGSGREYRAAAIAVDIAQRGDTESK
jgi:hypothetical protein